MGYNKLSLEEKVQLVLASLKGQESILELARRHGVADTCIHNWRKEFIEGGKARLSGNKNTTREKILEHENQQLKQVIGELTLANQLLKKLQKI